MANGRPWPRGSELRPRGRAAAEPIIGPGYTFGSVTDKISADRPDPADTPRAGGSASPSSFALVMVLLYRHRLSAASRASASGASTSRSAWGFAIVNFVWWIGIGHAGTLISAILLLLHQKWRTSINRFAEAMTLFAVACAGLFPLLAHGPAVVLLLAVPVPQHDGAVAAVPQPAGLGRVRGLHLRHRVAAVLVRRPDPRPGHPARPRAQPAGAGSSTASWRWAGAARRMHWQRYEMAYLLLAGLATPLVVSVHTVVSFDFAVGDRARLALDDLPALLRRRRHLFRLRHGADAGHPDARRFTAWRTSSPCATWTTWPRSCWRPG